MYAATKISEDLTEVKTHHIILIRSFFTWFAAYIYGKIDNVDFGYEAMSTWPKVVHVSLLKRSIYGFASMMCTFLSVSLMPVSLAVAIM